jgi:hypothetical protein
MNAKYSRFDLDKPWTPFVARELTYIFIPYRSVLETPEEKASSQSYFVGVSDDSGSTWKFFDGQSITQDNVASIIPGFRGGELPPVSVSRSPTS